MSLLNKLSLRTSVPIIIFILYTSLLLISLLYRLQTFEAQVEQQAMVEVKREMSRLQGLLSHKTRRSAENHILSMGLNPQVKNLSFIDEKGIVIYSTQLAMKGQGYHQFYPEIAKKLRIDLASKKHSQAFLSATRDSILSVYPVDLELIKNQLRQLNHGHLVLNYDLNEKKTAAWQQLVIDTTTGWVVGLIVYLVLVLFLAAFMSRPIAQLVRVTQRFAAGELEGRVEEKGPRELVELGKAFNKMAFDITLSYKKLADKTALYNVLSEANQAVVRSNDDEKLLSEICQIITDSGLFCFAWVGLLDQGSDKLIPVVSAGVEDKNMKRVKVSIDRDHPWGNGVTARAIRDNSVAVHNDIFDGQVDYPADLFAVAEDSGMKSVAAFPLSIGGDVVGALTIAHYEADYFSTEFVRLLSEVADDISFGLLTYRKEEERKRSAQLLSAQQIVLEKIAAGCSLDEIFEIVCQQLDHLLSVKKAHSAVCSIKDNTLEILASPGLPSSYKKTMGGLNITAGKLPSMDAVLKKERVIVSDFKGHHSWVDLESIATQNKLSACFCTPIISAGFNVVGTLDVYYQQATNPDKNELAIVDRFVYLCGLAIERGLSIENLRQREENLAVTLDSIGDAVITVDVGGRVTRLNPVASSLTGWSPEAAFGKPLHEVFHIVNTQTRIVLNNPVEKVILTGKVMGLANHTSLISKDGNEYQIADSAAPILDVKGELRGVILVFHDVTDNYAIQEALRKSHERLAAFNSVLPDLSFIFDEKGKYIEIHGADDSLLASERAVLLGRLIHDVLPQKQADRMLAVIQKTLATNVNQVFEYTLELPTGMKTFEARVAVMESYSNTAEGEVVWVARDISDRKKAEAEIERLAFYDPLTKIPNRRLLIDRLVHELSIIKRHRHHSAILFLDLDHFKTLNDSLGHFIGDSLLEQVAQRLSHQIRGEDTVARLGGDEFVILLSELNEDKNMAANQARGVAEKVQKVLAESFFLYEHEHYISVSIGIGLFSADTKANADDILKHADNAMYKAKALGRNQICFYQADMQDAADARLRLEKDLREALKNNDLVPFYQPQVNSKGACIGLEVLLRWENSAAGMISPAEFIPVAEESGLIIPIGEWVLRKSCQQIKTWCDAGIFGQEGQHFSVNISPKQFAQSDFVEQVQSIVNSVGIDPSLLYLEITEGLVIDNIDAVIEKIDALKAMKIQFSMDDFGTGYSSLSYLKRLPLQQLKIDRSFVRDIATDASDRAIIEVIMAVSERLELNVVAEGVETEEQVAFLIENGCDVFQGFYFGKPMSADNFVLWQKNNAI